MQPQRQTVTDRLADVIHIIHIGGKNGVLTVERGEGNAVEEGFITFVNGRVVEARAGRQTGLAAFNYLYTWQYCRFSLLNQSVSTSVYPALPSPAYHDTRLPMRKTLPSYRNDAGVQSTAPLRLRAGEEVLQQLGNTQLPRTHRRLLLLIDGHRKREDFARLMGRTLAEVQELLSDLERYGFIQP